MDLIPTQENILSPGGSHHPNPPSENLVSKANKTPLRLRYEAESEVIQKQLGSIEDIRQKLGLSRRKVCQLLLVDPSAWSRWTQTQAPPHIYRALQWYLALIEKSPSWHPMNSFSGVNQVLSRKQKQQLSQELKEEVGRIRPEYQSIESSLRKNQDQWKMDRSLIMNKLEHSVGISYGWKVLLFANSLLLIWLLFFKL